MLVTFGEALITYKPRPPRVSEEARLPLANPACEVIQAVGGAELNVSVAFARISEQDKVTSWVSVLPAGALGDYVLGAAHDARVVTSGVKRDGSVHSTIGTLHVVDDGAGPRPHYQRHSSAFCTTAGSTTFSWPSLLAGAQWLHVTGITPLLGQGPRAAWNAALEAAAAANAALNQPQARLCVSLDLNHRPSLGSLEVLWAMIKPHLFNISLLMLSEDTLKQLALLEGVWLTAGYAEGDQSTTQHAIQVSALRNLRKLWRVSMLGCCFKRPLEPTTGHTSTSTSVNKNTLMGGRGVRRWSVVAYDGGEATTERIPTEHAPVEALGGGDAWIGGFLHSLTDAPAGDETGVVLQRACRRGDLSAALSMASYGDLSDVKRETLLAAETRWRDAPASLIGAPPRARVDHTLTLNRLGRCRLVPVVAIDDPADAEPVARALLAGGLDVMELVLRSPAAEEALGIIASRVGEMLVGAGTVLSVEQAERSVAAGAKFLVAPGTNPKICQWAKANDVLMVPGVATATEVENAMGMGLTHLKFFPAEANGGAKMLKALSAPYSSIKWMPTGGVTEAIMPDYLALPSVFAVGGSWLVPAKALALKDYAAITALTRAALAAAGR